MRTYQRKTDRQKWSGVDMMLAINEVANGRMGFKKAAILHKVPRSTLESRVKKYRNGRDIQNAASKGLGSMKCVFTAEQELEIVQYIESMESSLFGLRNSDVRRLAYQLAEKKNLGHIFNRNKQMAGLDWLRGFMKRHPGPSLGSQESTSAEWTMGFTKGSGDPFFENLNNIMGRHKFPPERIFSADETGVTADSNTLSESRAQKGRILVGNPTSANRLITVQLCFSAAGHYVPPLVIFPRPQMDDKLLEGGPPGAIFACHESGCIQEDTFLQWMHHFVEHTKASKTSPVLLLLNRQGTHFKNLKVIDIARDNGVTMLCFPPHCSPHMQPLDTSIVASINACYSEEVEQWLRDNPGGSIQDSLNAKLVGSAYAKAATMETAIAGFRKTGIFPINPYVFRSVDSDFAATVKRLKNDTTVAEDYKRFMPASFQPGHTTSSMAKDNESDRGKEFCPQPGSSPLLFKPETVMAIAHWMQNSKTTIPTDSPYKNSSTEAVRTDKTSEMTTILQRNGVEPKKEKAETFNFDEDNNTVWIPCNHPSRSLKRKVDELKLEGEYIVSDIDPESIAFIDSNEETNGSAAGSINASLSEDAEESSSSSVKANENYSEIPKRSGSPLGLNVGEETKLDTKIDHNKIKEEFVKFGESIAAQLAEVPDSYSRSVAKLRINQILFEAEIGVYAQTRR